MVPVFVIVNSAPFEKIEFVSAITLEPKWMVIEEPVSEAAETLKIFWFLSKVLLLVTITSISLLVFILYWSPSELDEIVVSVVISTAYVLTTDIK